MSKARELAELSRTVADSADAVAITINSNEEVTFASNIDVTGTATVDGLTVDGTATIQNATSPSLRFLDTNAANSNFLLYSPDGNNSLRIKAGSTQTDAFSVASSGDISFYEDTGTTAKLFWDASAESLTLSGSGAGSLTLDRGASGNQIKFANAGTTLGYFGYIDGTGFSIAGSDGGSDVVVDSSGNVGIGTSSVDSLLHLSKASGGSIIRLENPDVALSDSEIVGRIEFETQDNGGSGVNSYIQSVGQGTGGANKLEFGTGTSGSPSTRLVIDSSGNVGIGTSSGQKPLHVNSGTGNIGVRVESSDATASIEFMDSGTTSTALSPRIGGISDDFFVQTSGSERMRIISDGEIRTSNAVIVGRLADRQAQAVGVTDATIVLAGNSNASGAGEEIGKVAFYTQDASGAGHNLAATVKALTNSAIGANADLVFSTKQGAGEGAEALESMRIDASGNVGIGTNSPTELLEVNSTGASAAIEVSAGTASTTTGEAKIVLRSLHSASGTTYSRSEIASVGVAGGDSDLVFRTTSDSSGPQERMRIDDAGNVGIGRSANIDYLLDVQKPADAYIRISSSTTQENAGIILANQNNTKWTIEKDGSAHNLFVKSASVTAMTISQAGNVGINTAPSAWSSSSTALQIGSLALEDFAVSGANASNILNNAFRNSSGNFAYKETDFSSSYGQYNGEHRFNVAASGTAGNDISFTRAMTIAASGIVLVGTTDSTLYNNTSGGGINLFPNGSIHCAKQSTTTTDPAMLVNNTGVSGDILQLRKDGAVLGKLANTNSYFFISGGSISGTHSGLRFIDRSSIRPCTATGGNLDNIIDLGAGGARFDDIYATNGTIQTSDRNEKQDIAELSDAEQRVAVAAKGLLRKFRWKNSVAEKGDEARTHFGIIAQDLQSAFETEGLDADDYAMFINSTWTDEETGEERSRMGVRYAELLAFIIAAI